jgi:hypothetical protein
MLKNAYIQITLPYGYLVNSLKNINSNGKCSSLSEKIKFIGGEM